MSNDAVPDIFNRCAIASAGDNVLMLRPPRAPMTADEAITLAAWLVVTAEMANKEPTHKFEDVLEAVRNC